MAKCKYCGHNDGHHWACNFNNLYNKYIELEAAAQKVIDGIISGGYGSATPCFDEFDREEERNRGTWYQVGGKAIDELREILEGGENNVQRPL